MRRPETKWNLITTSLSSGNRREWMRDPEGAIETAQSNGRTGVHGPTRHSPVHKQLASMQVVSTSIVLPLGLMRRLQVKQLVQELANETSSMGAASAGVDEGQPCASCGTWAPPRRGHFTPPPPNTGQLCLQHLAAVLPLGPGVSCNDTSEHFWLNLALVHTGKTRFCFDLFFLMQKTFWWQPVRYSTQNRFKTMLLQNTSANIYINPIMFFFLNL